MTTGCDVGDPLEEGPPGGEQLLRSRAPDSTPSRASSAGSIQRRSSGIGDVLGDGLGDLRARRRLVVRLAQARPAADHLARAPRT